MEEYLDIFDAEGHAVGSAPRSRCHGDPTLRHRVVHIAVFSSDGQRILLQKRLPTKRIQPGKWDTAVGGHVASGETPDQAAKRELSEELGITGQFKFWFESEIRNDIEWEQVFIYRMVHNGPFTPASDEIAEVKFFPLTDFSDPAKRERDDFTPNLRQELKLILERLHPEKKID